MTSVAGDATEISRDITRESDEIVTTIKYQVGPFLITNVQRAGHFDVRTHHFAEQNGVTVVLQGKYRFGYTRNQLEEAFAIAKFLNSRSIDNDSNAAALLTEIYQGRIGNVKGDLVKTVALLSRIVEHSVVEHSERPHIIGAFAGNKRKR